MPTFMRMQRIPQRQGKEESIYNSTAGSFWPGISDSVARPRLVVISQSYYYFSSSVSFFQIPDSLRDLTQPVTLVDDRCYLSGRYELAHDGQVLFARSRNEHDELLAHEP